MRILDWRRDWSFWLCTLVGLGIHTYAASVTWIGADQAHLLRLGAKFATNGEIVPFGKLLHGGGTNPGILLQLLFGVPMWIWPVFRSPMALVIVFGCIGFLILSRIVYSVYGQRALLPLALAYWLSPWRIFYSSLLWEPAFIYLPAVLHLLACYKLREKPSFLYSALCVGSVVCAMQIHNSFFVLVVASALLLWKGKIRMNWPGAVLGACIAGLTLIPSILAVVNGNLVYDAQQSQGYIGHGLVTVLPTLKGLLYWCTLGGVDVVRNLKETSYAEGSGKFMIYALQILCILTVLISIRASWWYFRPLWVFRGHRPEDHQHSSTSRWLRLYALSIMVGLVVSAALSPTVLQGWQVVIALHAAILPMVVWFVQRWCQKESKDRTAYSMISYAILEMVLLIVLISGQSIFQPSSQRPSDLDPVRDSLVIRYLR